MDTRSSADNDAGKLKRVEAMRTLRECGTTGYAEAFVQGALGKTTLEERPQIVEAVKEMAAGNDPRELIGALLAMAARTDTTGILEQIDLPTLVVVGAADTLTPLDLARELDARIEGSRLVMIPAAGHLPPLETPEEFGAAVETLLEGLAAPS